MQHVPSVRIAAGMLAVYAVKGSRQQAADPNRGMVTDINVVSTYLPYCDAMFIDDECADLLAELEESVTHEHIELVERVYGPGWLMPFREIFTSAD
jgi:hypothetical protein